MGLQFGNPIFILNIMAKIQFTKGVFNHTKTRLNSKILQAVESSPKLRQEIAQMFQMANRRIQNIEKAGLMSPAVVALNKGDINSFTKFSMSQDWNSLKVEYAKAISFLRQPTSMATGVRQYNNHLMKAYDLTPDEFNLMAQSLNDKLSSVSDSDFVERYLMRYKDFTGELEQASSDVSQQIESEATSIQNAIDNDIEQLAESVLEIENILKNFENFGL